MKVIFVLLIFHKLTINQADETINELVTIATSVRKFYSSPSIFLLYDHINFGFEKDRVLVEAIIRYSIKNSMSQALEFNDLERTYKRQENALYAFTIHTWKMLDRAINATKKAEMSAHPWLLLIMGNVTGFDCDKPGKIFFKLRMDTKMITKCEGNDVLKRYYAILENQTEVTNFAEWTPEKKLQFVNAKSLVEVETDFKGITLNMAKRTEVYDKANRNVANFQWFLMHELASIGNFKINVKLRKDKSGYFDSKTKKWIGLMKMIIEKKADVGMILFSMSWRRSQVVDFVTPIITGQCSLHARLPDTVQVSWTVYFQAFNINSWIAIATSIVVSSMLVCFMKKRQNILISSLGDNFINVWGIYNQQGSSENTKITSVRIVCFFILVTSLILYYIYSAAIASYITALEIRLPFSTYEEFKLDTSYKLAVLKYSNDKTFIEGNDTLLSPLKHRLKDECDLPADPVEGIKQVCTERTALYTDMVTYRGLTKPPDCTTSSVKINRIKYLSFILPKNSPYTATISYLVLRLREYGILKKLENEYFYNFTEISQLQAKGICFGETQPIFAILIIGVILASFIYLIELITYHIYIPVRSIKIKNLAYRRNRRVFKTRNKVTYQRKIRFRLLIMRNNHRPRP